VKSREPHTKPESFTSSVWLSIPAIIAMVAVTGVLSIVLLNYLRPTADNDPLVLQILGFLTLVLNLLKSQEVHNLVNNRMTELGEQIGMAEHARGRAEAIAEHVSKTIEKAKDEGEL
jgi:hypothetical protein